MAGEAIAGSSFNSCRCPSAEEFITQAILTHEIMKSTTPQQSHNVVYYA